jgi:hypothetical protein
MARTRIHRVCLMKDGKPADGNSYQEVSATTEKEAAEKLHGGVLFKQGTIERLRAMVLSSGATENPTLFYERFR